MYDSFDNTYQVFIKFIFHYQMCNCNEAVQFLKVVTHMVHNNILRMFIR